MPINTCWNCCSLITPHTYTQNGHAHMPIIAKCIQYSTPIPRNLRGSSSGLHLSLSVHRESFARVRAWAIAARECIERECCTYIHAYETETPINRKCTDPTLIARSVQLKLSWVFCCDVVVCAHAHAYTCNTLAERVLLFFLLALNGT